jgi:peroxiredoxin
VQKHYEEIQQAGGDVLVVSFTPPSRVAAYVARYPQPFPVVSDVELRAYKAFGLERTSVGSILRPGVLFRYVKVLFRGWMPRPSGAGEDLMQLGGDFIVDAEGKLRYAYPSADPADRPSAQDLLEAFRLLGFSKKPGV